MNVALIVPFKQHRSPLCFSSTQNETGRLRSPARFHPLSNLKGLMRKPRSPS